MLLLAFISLGCARIKTTETFPIKYQFTDFPQERKIKLEFFNNYAKTVCLLPEMWPDSKGKIDGAGDRMFLIVRENRYPVASFNTGYCLGNCYLRVSPGEKITTFIPYDYFNIPEDLVFEKKRLEFIPYASFCRPEEN